MWILSLRTVTTYSELMQVNDKVTHTKDTGDDWKNLYDSKLVTLINSGRLCFEDIFKIIIDCHDQKLKVRLIQLTLMSR